MADVQHVIDRFSVFQSGSGGIGRWISNATDTEILQRIADIDKRPLALVQLNQLLTLGHEATVSADFFRYYWLDKPVHTYPVDKIDGYSDSWWRKIDKRGEIYSLDQLYWGMYRLFVDGLLYFGNARSAFRALRSRSYLDIQTFFRGRRYDTDSLMRRGPALPLYSIQRDSRYLISEMACKSYGSEHSTIGELGNALMEAWAEHAAGKGGRIAIKSLLNGEHVREKYAAQHQQLLFSADELLESEVSSQEEVLSRYQDMYRTFTNARERAAKNTQLYLSMVGELDVYVATSMRFRKDFREVADICESVFHSPQLREMNLRYFDPTLSAADGHEDKGIIECLMVKCAKALLYCAGDKDSYGKDAEAAMALSLGKPVVFLCPNESRARFYREIHPLCRLIHFESGVAVGAMVTHKVDDVVKLLDRILHNQMEYRLEQHPRRPGYLRLKEVLTDSIVRLHTDDRLLSETFWNQYNQRVSDGPIRAHF